MDDERLSLARRFVRALPYARALGMEVEAVRDGGARMSLGYDPRFVGDPETGVLHGGVVTALLDTCSGAAVLLHPRSGGSTATIDLRIDYMRAGTPGRRLMADAEVYRVTRTVAFVRALAWTGSIEEPTATATGAFTFEMTGGTTADMRGAA